jgi:hypothetical protein
MADAEGKFVTAVGPDVAEGIEHFQPAPPLGSLSYQKFQKLMGATDETALYLFAGNTHDQICTLALAMEKAKSTDPLVYTKEIPAVDNPPGRGNRRNSRCPQESARRRQDQLSRGRIDLRFRPAATSSIGTTAISASKRASKCWSRSSRGRRGRFRVLRRHNARGRGAERRQVSHVRNYLRKLPSRPLVLPTSRRVKRERLPSAFT